MSHADDVQTITEGTLEHYRQRAEAFRAGTADHDVSQNIDALLRHIQVQAPFRILDLGCGPGRDLRTFTELGHQAVGLDGTEPFVLMARETDQEGWSGGRYGVWYDWQAWKARVEAAGFDELEHYYRPAGLPREQSWLASVWRRR